MVPGSQKEPHLGGQWKGATVDGGVGTGAGGQGWLIRTWNRRLFLWRQNVVHDHKVPV